METYQAIYDAVRSKIASGNINEVVENWLRCQDFSNQINIIKQDFLNVSYEMQRPSVLYKPKLSKDGNQWCALLGDNLQIGLAGFGDTPAIAMNDFDNNWNK